MPKHEETLTLPYTPQQCFELVADVARYPEFLPWCKAARVSSRTDYSMNAELVISFHSLRESYTSHITLERPARIEVRQINGPFEVLDTLWQFKEIDGGTEIFFSLEFRFRSRLLEAVIGKLYHKAVEKMTAAFVTRAHLLYS